MGRVATLPELCDDGWLIRASQQRRQEGFEACWTFLLVAGLVRSHVWMQVVDDVLISVQLAIELHQGIRVVGITAIAGDDDRVRAVLANCSPHFQHATCFGIAVHPGIQIDPVRLVEQLKEDIRIITKLGGHRVPELDTVGCAFARHGFGVVRVIVCPMQVKDCHDVP
jgi:hypothetical protein